MTSRRFILLITLIAYTYLSYGQVKRGINNNYFVQKNFGLHYYTGTLIPHDVKLDSLKRGFIKSYEVDLCLGTNGRKYWQNFYHFPSYGFTYMFTDFNYKQVLGTALSVSPYIKFNLVNSYSFNIRLKIAPGIALFEKKYDSLLNKQNIAISSHFNILIHLGLQANIRLADRLFYSIGISALHYSNGSYKKPNYGLNYLTVNTGFNYNLNVYQKIPPYFRYQKKEKDRWFLTISGAVKETGDPGGPKYGVIALSSEYSRPIKKLLRYGASFDIMHDNSTIIHFKEDSVSFRSNLLATKIGGSFMGEMMLDRLSAFANFGIYLYNKDRQDQRLYQKVGLRYRFSDFLYCHIALKTHSNFADYLEFGISYNIKAKYYKKRTFKDYKINSQQK